MKRMFLFLLVFVPLLIGTDSCAGRPIATLCIFDFPKDQPIFPNQKICWVNQDEDIGFTFLELLEENFFALSARDLQKVLDKLNECEHGK